MLSNLSSSKNEFPQLAEYTEASASFYIGVQKERSYEIPKSKRSALLYFGTNKGNLLSSTIKVGENKL